MARGSVLAAQQRRAALTGAALGLGFGLGLLALLALLVHGAVPQAAALLGPHAPLMLLPLLAATGAGAGLALAWHRRSGAPLARLAEQAPVLLATPGLRLPADARGPVLATLAGHIDALAAARDTLQDQARAEASRLARHVERERARLAAVVEQLAFGVVVCNAEGRVLLVNRRARLQFRALADTPANAADADAALGGHAFVGLGRSIYAVFDREMVAQALARLERRRARGAAQPSAQFVAATRRGQWLRVRVARVDDDEAAAAAGFVLMLEGIAAEQAQAAERSARVIAAGERGRDALAALQGQVPPEVLAPARQALEALRAEAERALATRWPLEAINGSDLLHVCAGHLQTVTGQRVFVETPDAEAAAFGLNVDCWSLQRALAQLATRVAEAFEPPHLRLGLAALLPASDGPEAGAEGAEVPAEGRAVLMLVWPGGAMSTETVMGWELDPLPGDDTSVREVLRRHDATLWFERDRPRQQALLKLSLPRLPLREPAAPARGEEGARLPAGVVPGARPEFYDFELFARSEASGPLAERPLASLVFTVFDTETTGLDPRGGDEIIQIGAVRVLGGRVLHGEAFDQLVDPRRSIPAAGMAIHGIRPEQVAGQPDIRAVLPRFAAFCDDTVLVGHNAAFDLRFLQLKEAATGVKFEQPVLDTLLLSAVLHPQQASHRLEAIAERLGVAVSARHDALGDARVTAEVFVRLLPLLAARGIVTLGQAQEAARETWYARLAY